MIEEIKTAYRFLIVIGIAVVMLLLSVTVPIISSNADFSIYNTSWNGCSSLGREAYETGSFIPTIDISGSTEERILHSPLDSLGDDLDPRDSAIMIIGPETEFTDAEVDYIKDYIAGGGILFLADDFGTGSELLYDLQTETTISGVEMKDLSFMKSSEFAVTRDIESHNITAGIDTLMMNHPSTVSMGKTSRSLINSSGTSWLEKEPNDKRDADEPLGPFPILTIEEYGDGELIVLSDPSMLINNMILEFNNSRLVSNLISYITDERGTLVIDESHRDQTNPVHYTKLFVGTLDIREKIGIITGIIILFIVISSPYPRKIWNGLERLLNKLLSEEKKKGSDLEENLEKVFKKHPDWDRDLMRRLIDDIEGK